MPTAPEPVTKHCPVDDRAFTASTEAAAIEKVRKHLSDQAQYDEAHAGVYNSEGWWNDFGN
jgi:hypothetical protein